MNTLENGKRQVAEGSHLCAAGSPLSQAAARCGGRGSCARPGAQAWGLAERFGLPCNSFYLGREN